LQFLEKAEEKLIKTTREVGKQLAVIPDSITAFTINSYFKITKRSCKQKVNHFGLFCYYSKFFFNKENVEKICKYNASNPRRIIKKAFFPYYCYCACNKDEKENL